MEKYLELKKTIENFLEVRKNSIQEMKLKESNGLNIQYYLYLVNCLIYEQLEKIPKNFKDEHQFVSYLFVIGNWKSPPTHTNEKFSSRFTYIKSLLRRRHEKLVIEA